MPSEVSPMHTICLPAPVDTERVKQDGETTNLGWPSHLHEPIPPDWINWAKWPSLDEFIKQVSNPPIRVHDGFPFICPLASPLLAFGGAPKSVHTPPGGVNAVGPDGGRKLLMNK
jgi:hypothetical protein